MRKTLRLLWIFPVLLICLTEARGQHQIIAESFSEDGTIARIPIATQVVKFQSSRSRSQSSSLLPLSAPIAVTDLVKCGSAERCVDLYFLGEGYALQDMERYRRQVDESVRQLFALQPFKKLKRLFNIKRLDIISNESGVSDSPFELKDTAFLSNWYCPFRRIPPCLDLDEVKRAAGRVGEWDYLMVMLNSPINSGYALTSQAVGVSGGEDSIIPKIVVHELGHIIGELADEYDSNFYDFERRKPTQPNVTSRRGVKWKVWLKEPAGREYDGPTGYFEGAQYFKKGIFRPSPNSVMRTIGRKFNRPSADALTARIIRRAFPPSVDGSSSKPLSSQREAVFLKRTDSIVLSSPRRIRGLKTNATLLGIDPKGAYSELATGSRFQLKRFPKLKEMEGVEVMLSVFHPDVRMTQERRMFSNIYQQWFFIPRAKVPHPLGVKAEPLFDEGAIQLSWELPRKSGRYTRVFKSYQPGRRCQPEDEVLETEGKTFYYAGDLDRRVYYSLRTVDSGRLSRCVVAPKVSVPLIPPRIITQLPPLIGTRAGRLVTLRVGSYGTVLRYDWYKDGEFFQFTGINELTFLADESLHNSYWSVVLVGAEETVSSEEAYLAVTAETPGS